MRSNTFTTPCRFLFTSVLLLIISLLTGCGDGLSGTYINLSDPQDRIEFTSGSTAKITAIQGQSLEVWEYGGSALTPLGKQFQDARRAMTNFETVEVEYEWDDKGTIRFKAPGRGSRTVKVDKDRMKINDFGNRKKKKK